MFTLYSRYVKKRLVYITTVALSSLQPSSYTKYIKSNVRSSYNVYSISNTKYTRSITLNSYYIPLLIALRVLGLIYYYKA